MTASETLRRSARRLGIAIKRRRVLPVIELLSVLLMLATALVTYLVFRTNFAERSLLSPGLVAGLLIANLVPAMMLIALVGRRIARGRAVSTALGSNGTLHVRLVALFSAVAAVPTLLVVIFAASMFQSGVNFWFSERSRGMFENAASLAEGYYAESQRSVGANTRAMALDLRNVLQRVRISSPEFASFYLQQVVVRELNESAIIEFGADGVARTPAMVNPDNRAAEGRITQDMERRLQKGADVVVETHDDRVEAATLLQPGSRIYVYAARDTRVFGLNQFERARTVLNDYNNLYRRSQALQTRFLILLYVVSLLLVGLAMWAALIVADRLVRPVVALAEAARRVEQGDFGARVPHGGARDEVGLLSSAFNRMTGRLEKQTAELVGANHTLDARRAFMETVLSGVRSGVISLDAAKRIRLINQAAQDLLKADQKQLEDRPLADVLPELVPFLDSPSSGVMVDIGSLGEPRTLRVKTAVTQEGGRVVTFEDVTDQLLDQRRAAWSDVARRIAHEIRNPLTPIQLAAERLQRRYASSIEGEGGTFSKLTDTIIRQVGDLRRMVDEFSSFARMPKPVFRVENIVDLVRQSVFLHEVANSQIRFSVHSAQQDIPLVCDRHQLSQAFSNIIKNAIEAIEEKKKRSKSSLSDEFVDIEIEAASPTTLRIRFTDSGVGLPANSDALFEPYMTTREGGTGLGLAIVKKIVEEHLGEIGFSADDAGKTQVTILFRPEALKGLIALDGDPGDAALQESLPKHIVRRASSGAAAGAASGAASGAGPLSDAATTNSNTAARPKRANRQKDAIDGA